VPGEATPMTFYQRYGFALTGRIADDEQVLRLDLGGRRRNGGPA
jgi:hypothetical protein